MKMCLTCWNAVTKYFPLLTREEQVNLLWCGTAFPAGCGDQVDQQLQELEKKSNGNYEDAMTITHREFDEAWERDRPLREKWERESEEAQKRCVAEGPVV